MSNRFFIHPLGLGLGLVLSEIALCLLAIAFLNRQPPTATTEEIAPPDAARAIVIDPVTQAVTLEAIDSQ